MSISKKIRFEVFKRDDFICQYCGKTPPEVMLEIDHLIPKSKKGADGINNLITSCFDCNRGKSNIKLETVPSAIKENYEILKEKELQLKEYRKLIMKIENRINNDIEKIANIYTEYFDDYILTEKFKNISLKKFVTSLPLNEVMDAMNLACQKINHSDRAINYFCGICWNKIRGTY